MELIGRDAERRRLAAAISDPDVGLVIVRGLSGAGKTVLVDAVLSDLSPRGYIVGRGKYAENALANGFAPILQALSQAVSSALDLLYDPAAGAESLRTTLGGHLALLDSAGFGPIDVLPPPDRADAPSLSGGDSSARIVDAIARLVRWLYGFGAPVALFIDDWQRAPQEAHPLATIAARDQSLRLCTVVFAERSAARDVSHANHKNAEVIELGPLDATDQISLLGRAVGDQGAGAAISTWLGADASGLPFDLREAARALVERSAIACVDGAWTIDLARAASIDRRDFTNTFVRRARALPRDVLDTGVAFALWGDRAPLARVADALDRPARDVEAAVHRLESEGIVTVSGIDVSFVHDRMRVGLLTASEDTIRRDIAAGMADRLLDPGGGPAARRAACRFRLAAGLEQASASVWRDRFAREAAIARNTADISAANSFAEAAFTLRARHRSADRPADSMVLREASLAAAARREVSLVRSRVSEMIALAGTMDEIADAYQTGIVAASLAGDQDLAWTWSIEGLRRLGARLPSKARRINILIAAAQWWIGLLLPSQRPPPGHTPDTIDPVRRVVHFATVIAYVRQPAMMLVMSLRAATRARRLGYLSAFYTSVDLVHFAAFGFTERAARLGEEVARAPLPATFGRAATLYRALYMGLIWTMPLAALREGFTRVYDFAISEGDLVYAGQAVRNAAQFAWRIEPTLEGVLPALQDSVEKAEQLGDTVALQGMHAFAEMIRTLQDPEGLTRVDANAPWTRLGVSAGAGAPIVWVEVLGFAGDWAGVLALTRKYEAARPGLNPHPGGIIWRFHENLARMKLGLAMRRGDLRHVRRAARLNPADHQRKLLILEAERLRRKGNAERCLNAYANAVEIAAAGTSRLEAGLAAECAGAAARAFGRPELAARYDALAHETWRAWGALAKIGKGAKAPGEALHSVAPQLAEAESKAAVAHRSERAKSRFLAEVGHELRTPLQGMQGLLDLAADAPSEVSMHELRDVFGSLKRVVDDLTDFAALGGGAPLKLKAADIVALVESEAHLAAAMAQRKGLALVVDLPASTPLVKIDGARVRQIVRNLLSNAVKYTDRGEIRLRVVLEHRAAGDQVDISIIVEDSGAGLSEAELLRLFEPFERGEREDVEGLGLGLALSRRIAERMGGTLRAENRPQGGASFLLAFCAACADGEESPATPTAQLRILLVEDVALNRRIIAAMLARSGHRVSEAADGAEALDLFQKTAFELVLIDIGLPDLGGFEVIDAMKQSSPAQIAKIVVLTASTSALVEERARLAGAALVLHKPISRDELDAAIHSVFSLTPATVPPPPGDYDAELAALHRQAQAEILARGRALIAAALSGHATAHEAHRLAGLAAQFGAADVAAAADRTEADLTAGVDPAAAFATLETALSAIERSQALFASGDSAVQAFGSLSAATGNR